MQVAMEPIKTRAALGTLLLAAALGYLATAPAAINGDGIGYLKQLAGRDLAPGHVLYLPLARAVTSPWSDQPLRVAATALRGLSLAAAVVALLLLLDTARQLGLGAHRSLFSTALLAVSYGFMRAAHEVEVYSPALAASVAAVWALTRLSTAGQGGAASPGRRSRAAASRSTLRTRQMGWAVAAGTCGALATGLHLSLGLIAIPLGVLAWRWRGMGPAVVALVVFGLGCSAVLGWALAHQSIDSLEPAYGWLHSADHGIPYPLSPATPLIAAWGFCKTLLVAPYPHQASWPRVAVQSSAAVAAMAVLLWLRRRGLRDGAARGRLDPVSAAAWCLPLAAFGLLFFPSDTERWLFVWPVFCLWCAPAASRTGWLLLGLVALVNLALLLPTALDDAPVRRASAVEQLTTRADLLVAPGHGWSEQVGLGDRDAARPFPLVYYVGKHRSLAGARTELDEAIAATRRRGGRVFAARLADRKDRRGFKELAWYGMSRRDFAELLRPYRPRPTSAVGLWQLTRLRKE